MMRDDVLAAFLEEYDAETRRLEASSAVVRPERKVELLEVERQIAAIKTAIFEGISPTLFVAELKQLEIRRHTLEAELAEASIDTAASALLHSDSAKSTARK